jgi:hypothetical protein
MIMMILMIVNNKIQHNTSLIQRIQGDSYGIRF